MSKSRKIIVIISVCTIALCSILAPIAARAESRFGDWEYFYSFNKSILQRHAHSRVLLRVPIFRQAQTYTSGVACVQSLLRYAKYEFDIREDNLANALDADEEYGVRAEAMTEYLNSVRFNDEETQYFNAEFRQGMTLEDLKKELDKGNPVICDIQAWNWNYDEEYSMDLDYSNEWGCGHWVVAVGYNRDNIFFMDPSTSANYTYIPNDKLESRWHDYEIDERGNRSDNVQAGIVVELCSGQQPDGERYYDAFYGLM